MDRLDLGLLRSSAFWNSLSRTCLDVLAANVTVCVYPKNEAATISATLENLLVASNIKDSEWYLYHSRHRSLWCYNAQTPPWHFLWKLKKGALQMSKGNRMLYSLYPALSGKNRTCSNTEIYFCASAFHTPWSAETHYYSHYIQSISNLFRWKLNNTKICNYCVLDEKVAPEQHIPNAGGPDWEL